jgi:hypothetical protein
MRCVLHSSHVTGDFASGRLEVQIAREDTRSGVTVVDDINFSVPTEFRIHNDAVAAALLTLIGGYYPSVSFNFPISTHCATLLRDYYRLDELGPIDGSLEPRRPGTRVAVSFSGGLDSTAVVVLLRELAGIPALTITNDYGGGFAFERHGFGGVRQDIVCATDFRAKGYFRHGNFNLATPLLFADYLDLRYVANGDSFANDLIGLASLADGSPPRFLPHAASLQAGGLEELHVARFLCLPGLLRVLVAAAPRLLEDSFRASGPPGAFKPYFKGVALRCLYADDGVDPPAFLAALTPPTRPTSYGNGPAKDMSIAWVAKRVGVQPLLPVFPNLAGADLSFLDELDVRLHERYCPNFIGLVPPELRQPLLSAFHACGIYPFTEHDWHELAVLRANLPALRGRA